MEKLTLNEDMFEDAAQEPVVSEPDQAPVDDAADTEVESIPVSSMINQMIKGEFDAIDLYNGVLVALTDMGNNEKAIEVINDIVAEEYVHVGQLEKLLEEINPASEEIESGKAEAEEQVGAE